MTRKKTNINQVQIISYIMLIIGSIFLANSFFSNSSIAAIIGLGLAFWGAVLLYIKPEGTLTENLSEAAVSPSLATLNQLIQKLGYEGDTIYLPPKLFTNPETTKMYITKHKDEDLPTVEQTIMHENENVSLTPQAIFLTPPGIQLSRLLEKRIGKKFTDTNLENLQRELPTAFTSDLQIASSLEMQIFRTEALNTSNFSKENKYDKPPSTINKTAVVNARITNPAKGIVLKERGSLDCAICSAIAIALTKATGKPVRIIETNISETGYVAEASYMIMEN